MLKDSNNVKISNNKKGNLLNDSNLIELKNINMEISILVEDDYTFYVLGSGAGGTHTDLTSLGTVAVGKWIVVFEDPENPPATWYNGLSTAANFTRHTDVILTTLKMTTSNYIPEYSYAYELEIDGGQFASGYTNKLTLRWCNLGIELNSGNVTTSKLTINTIGILENMINIYQDNATATNYTLVFSTMGENLDNSKFILYPNRNALNNEAPVLELVGGENNHELLYFESKVNTAYVNGNTNADWGKVIITMNAAGDATKIINSLFKNIGEVEINNVELINIGIDITADNLFTIMTTDTGVTYNHPISYVNYYADIRQPVNDSLLQYVFKPIDRAKTILNRKFLIDTDLLYNDLYECSISISQRIETEVKYANTFKQGIYNFQFKDNWYIQDELKYFDYDDYLVWLREDIEDELMPLVIQNSKFYTALCMSYRWLTSSSVDFEATGIANATDAAASGGSFSRITAAAAGAAVSAYWDGYVLNSTATGGYLELDESNKFDYSKDWSVSMFLSSTSSGGDYEAPARFFTMFDSTGAVQFYLGFSSSDLIVYDGSGNTTIKTFGIAEMISRTMHILVRYDSTNNKLNIRLYSARSNTVDVIGEETEIDITLTESTNELLLYSDNKIGTGTGYVGNIWDVNMCQGYISNNLYDNIKTAWLWDLSSQKSYSTDTVILQTYRSDEDFYFYGTNTRNGKSENICYYDDMINDTLMGDVPISQDSNNALFIHKIYKILKQTSSVEYKNYLPADDSPLIATMNLIDTVRNYVVR